MLLGAIDLKRTSKGVDDRDQCSMLKLPQFYQPQNIEHRPLWYNKVKGKTTVASAHRQNGFDFKQIDNEVKVISILPDLPDVIARRILHIDTWKEEHPLLGKFYTRLSNDEKVLYTAKIIKTWAEQNVLESDIKIPMSDLHRLQNIGLPYSDIIIDGIYKDMMQYVSAPSKIRCQNQSCSRTT